MGDEKISTLIEDIALNRLVLPEIQREFVWSDQKVRHLIDSLYNEFPIGVILRWRPKNTSDFRLLEGQENVKRDPEWYLLDGQQRLTALNLVKDGQVKVLFNVDAESFSIENRARASIPTWIRVDEIWDKGSSKILEELAEKLETDLNSMYKEYGNKLRKIEDILKYTIPVFDIREEDYAKITEMYVRLNEQGTKLKKAEITLALIVLKFPKVFYEKLTSLVDDFDGWELDANFFLRCFVCMSTNQSKFEPLRKYLDTTSEKEVLSTLKSVGENLNLMFNFIKSNFGISEDNNERLIPSEIALIPLMLYYNKKQGNISTDEELNKLILWFFTASYFGRYSGPTESILNEDIRALKSSDTLSEWISPIRKDRGGLDIREFEGRYNRNNLFALFYALRRNNAIDWWEGNPLSNITKTEFHHIFPKKVLREANYPDKLINDVRNIAIVSRKANRKISAMYPEKYFKTEIQDINRVFSQFVPEDPKYWKVENFLDFLEEREKNIIQVLNNSINELQDNSGLNS